MIRINKLFVLVGASGSGKTTLGNCLDIPKLTTHTTRNIRKGEQQGREYYFVGENEFEELDLIEQTKYAGNYYGISKDEIKFKLNEYKKTYTILDINGAEKLKKMYSKNVIVIYINSRQKEVIQRLIDRGDDEFLIAERMTNANKKREFIVPDIANYVINNYDGKMYESKMLIKFIVNELE